MSHWERHTHASVTIRVTGNEPPELAERDDRLSQCQRGTSRARTERRTMDMLARTPMLPRYLM